jgi:hypothetical protein
MDYYLITQLGKEITYKNTIYNNHIKQTNEKKVSNDKRKISISKSGDLIMQFTGCLQA